MIIKERPLRLTVLALVYLPIFIFLMGWCRPYIAIPGSIALLYALYRYIRQVIIAPPEQEETNIEMHPLVFIVICCFIIFIGLFSGYGHWTDSHLDWPKHNAILHDMTSKEWPVIYHWDDKSYRMLSYYIGVYLLPATIGKLSGGYVAAELSLGIILLMTALCVILLLIKILGCNSWIKQILCVVCFLLFYGMSPICHKLNAMMGCQGGGHSVIADLPNIYYLHIKPIILVFTTYIQGIAPLGVCLCLINEKKPFGNLGIHLLPVLIFSPFLFVGLMLLYALFWVAERCRKRISIKDILTTENIIASLIACIFLIYFSGNILLDKPENTGLQFIKIKTTRNFVVFLSYCFFLFGIYLIILWKSFYRESLYLSLCCAFGVIPLFTMGAYNDWCQNCPLVLLLLLFLYVWKYFQQPHCLLRKVILAGVIVVGTYVPIEATRTLLSDGFSSPRWNFQTDGLMDHLNDEDPANRLSYRYNYVSGDINTDLFYKYIAKK